MTKICKNCKKAKSTHKGYEFWCDVEGLEPIMSSDLHSTQGRPRKVMFWHNVKSVDNETAYGRQMIQEGKRQHDKYFRFEESK